MGHVTWKIKQNKKNTKPISPPLCSEESTFAKRFEPVFKNLGLDSKEVYSAYKSFTLDISSKELLASFSSSQAFCEQLGNDGAGALLWSLGAITRKSSGELPMRNEYEKMPSL